MDYLPLQIPIKNKKCLVVGAGKVALRRVCRLLKCGAVVVVVAPQITESFYKLEKLSNLTCVADIYRAKYIKDAFLVAACTDDGAVNDQIYDDAKRLGIIVYTADRRRPDSAVFPAIIDKEGLIISLSTSGSYPLLTKYLKEKIAATVPDFIDKAFIERLEKERQKIIATVSDEAERKRQLSAFLDRLIEAGENNG